MPVIPMFLALSARSCQGTKVPAAFSRETQEEKSTSLQLSTSERGDRLRPDGAGVIDDADYTARQLRGVAIAGSVAGALVGGPMVAATVAAGALYVAATDDGGLGYAARSMGDQASTFSEETGKAINRTVRRSLSGCSSQLGFTDDCLEAEVKRREAELRSNSGRLSKIRRFSSNVVKRIKRKGDDSRAKRNDQRSGGRYKFRTRSTPRVRQRWKVGRKSSFNDQGDATDSSVTNSKEASLKNDDTSNQQRLPGCATSVPSSLCKSSQRALAKQRAPQPSIVYSIAKRSVKSFSFNEVQIRALSHHVTSQVLATIAQCGSVKSVTESSVSMGMRNNSIKLEDMQQIASYISHEVELAVMTSEGMEESSPGNIDMFNLAGKIARQVIMAVSHCITIEERKLNEEEMKSLAWLVKNKSLDAIKLSAKELKSLACYLKLQAQISCTVCVEGRIPTENFALTSEMEEVLAGIEERSEALFLQSQTNKCEQELEYEISCGDSVGSFSSIEVASRKGRGDWETEDKATSNEKSIGTKPSRGRCRPATDCHSDELCSESEYDDDEAADRSAARVTTIEATYQMKKVTTPEGAVIPAKEPTPNQAVTLMNK